MFSYQGEVYVSRVSTSETKLIPLFFSFQFVKTEYGWTEMGEIELNNQPKEANDMLEFITELLIEGIKEFETPGS